MIASDATSNAKSNDDNDDDDNKTPRKRRGMGLSKTSITGKWDREWKRLYTTGHTTNEGRETDRIKEKRKKEEEGKRVGGGTATRRPLKLLAIYLRSSPLHGSLALCVSIGCTKSRLYSFGDFNVPSA